MWLKKLKKNRAFPCPIFNQITQKKMIENILHVLHSVLLMHFYVSMISNLQRQRLLFPVCTNDNQILGIMHFNKNVTSYKIYCKCFKKGRGKGSMLHRISG